MIGFAEFGLAFAKTQATAPAAKIAFSVAHSAVSVCILHHTAKHTAASVKDSATSVREGYQAIRPQVVAVKDKVKTFHSKTDSVPNFDSGVKVT